MLNADTDTYYTYCYCSITYHHHQHIIIYLSNILLFNQYSNSNSRNILNNKWRMQDQQREVGVRDRDK